MTNEGKDEVVFSPQELNKNTTEIIKWQHYEYVVVVVGVTNEGKTSLPKDNLQQGERNKEDTFICH